MLESIQAMIAWAQAHPETAATVMLGMLALLNIAWAQLPKPASPGMQRAWVLVHHVLLMVVTHSSGKGTLTWPVLLRGILGGPDPFGELKEAEKPDVDPPLPPATVG